jgi:hypothetical protein
MQPAAQSSMLDEAHWTDTHSRATDQWARYYERVARGTSSQQMTVVSVTNESTGTSLNIRHLIIGDFLPKTRNISHNRWYENWTFACHVSKLT